MHQGQHWIGRERERASELLQNKAEIALVTDPEEWEVLGGCWGPVRMAFSDRTRLAGREVLRNKAEITLVTDPEGCTRKMLASLCCW